MPAVIDNPILNSPFAEPAQHWQLDDNGIPAGTPAPGRRRSEFIVPVPPPKHRVKSQGALDLEDEYGERKPNDYINEIRAKVGQWRALGDAGLRPLTPHHRPPAAPLARTGPRPPAVLLPGRSRRNRHLADGSSTPSRDRPPVHPERRSQSRPAAHRVQAGHRRRQDHRDGNADRLADPERRPGPKLYPLHRRVSDRRPRPDRARPACASCCRRTRPTSTRHSTWSRASCATACSAPAS